MFASVRLTDRLIVQIGESLGVRDGCEIVALSDAQYASYLALASGDGVLLAPDGTLSVAPPLTPPVRTPDALVDICIAFLNDAQIDGLIASDPLTLTPTQQAARKTAIALRALIRITARLVVELR